MTDETSVVTTQPVAPAPVATAVPDLTGAFLSGDSAALKSAIHDRVVGQVQQFVQNSAVLTGKVPPQGD